MLNFPNQSAKSQCFEHFSLKSYQNQDKLDQFYYLLAACIQQLNIMYQASHREDRQLRQSNLYEDLTQFIKTFKTIMASSESITSLLARSEQCLQSINLLKETLTKNQNIISLYNYQLQELSPHRNTHFRFVCRLIENLEVYKNSVYGSHSAYNIFNQFIKRTQSVLNTWKLEKNIGKLFKRIFSFTAKFCTSCQVVLNYGSHEEAIECFSKKEIEETDPKFMSTEGHFKKIHFNNSQSNFHKVMGGLTRRYSTMNCLDLDYNSFKSIFFQAKHQKNDLFKEILQRNYFISRQIVLYSKQFQDYLKRKEKQLVRKNRFKEGKILGNTFSMSFKKANEYNKSLDVTKVVETQKQEGIYESQRDDLRMKETTIKRFKTREGDMSQEKLLEIQLRKPSYQIKNVYLTLNKIHANSEINHKHQQNKKYAKDKGKVYSILKANKFALKSTKFVQSQFMKLNRPLLDIRHLDFKNMNIREQASNDSNQTDTKYETLYERKTDILMQKKNIRITQMLKKNSLNTQSREDIAETESIPLTFSAVIEEQQLHK